MYVIIYVMLCQLTGNDLITQNTFHNQLFREGYICTFQVPYI